MYNKGRIRYCYIIICSTTVRLGEFDISTPIDYDQRGDQHAPPPQDIAIEQTIVHEAYSARLKVNDIGLIRMAEEAAYNDSK